MHAHARNSTPEWHAPPESSIIASPADDEAVRDLFVQLLAAWGRGDGPTYGALFTEDAEYIAFDGSRIHGQQEIADAHQRLFDYWLKGTRLVGQIERLQFLSSEIALLHATGSTIFHGQRDAR